MDVFIPSIFTNELQVNNKIIDTFMTHWTMDRRDLAGPYTSLLTLLMRFSVFPYISLAQKKFVFS